jgi:glycosyltransferase involved in cell wall biosynthesis
LKKVVHLSTHHSVGNVRLFTKECRSLAKAGYAVTLVAPYDHNTVVDGVQIKAIPKESRRLKRMTVTTGQVYREAIRLDADLYHLHMVELIPVGLLLLARGKKVIYDCYEDAPRSILTRFYLPDNLKRPISWLLERLENFAAPRFSAVVAATPTIGARFQSLNTHTVVVNNFPLQDELRPPNDVSWAQRSMAVTYLGALAPPRGLYQMIEAMAYMPDHLGATLKLAGPFSPPESRIKATRLQGWKWVEELGILSRSQVAKLLSQVSAGLAVYLPAPNHIEAMPNKLFEYMAAGIPMIASDFPLWREIVEKAGCGLLADPLDPQAIAEASEHQLTHPAEAEAMGKRGRRAVEKSYNWEKESEKLIDLYSCFLDAD